MSELVMFLAVSRARRAFERGEDLRAAANHAAAAFGVPARAVLGLACTAVECVKLARCVTDCEPPAPPYDDDGEPCVRKKAGATREQIVD